MFLITIFKYQSVYCVVSSMSTVHFEVKTSKMVNAGQGCFAKVPLVRGQIIVVGANATDEHCRNFGNDAVNFNFAPYFDGNFNSQMLIDHWTEYISTSR